MLPRQASVLAVRVVDGASDRSQQLSMRADRAQLTAMRHDNGTAGQTAL